MQEIFTDHFLGRTAEEYQMLNEDEKSPYPTFFQYLQRRFELEENAMICLGYFVKLAH